MEGVDLTWSAAHRQQTLAAGSSSEAGDAACHTSSFPGLAHILSLQHLPHPHRLRAHCRAPYYNSLKFLYFGHRYSSSSTSPCGLSLVSTGTAFALALFPSLSVWLVGYLSLTPDSRIKSPLPNLVKAGNDIPFSPLFPLVCSRSRPTV